MRGTAEKLGLLFLHREQLINGVENLFLNAGARVELLFGEKLPQVLVHPCRAVIAIGHSVAEAVSVLIQKHEINAPGIHAHTRRNLADLGTAAQSCLDLGKQRVRIPAATSVFLLRPIGEAPDLFQAKLAVLHPAKLHFPAGRSDINGQIICFHTPLPSPPGKADRIRLFAFARERFAAPLPFHCRRKRKRRKGRCL